MVQISPQDIPLLPSQCQLKSDNVWTMEEKCLQSEVNRLALEHGDVALCLIGSLDTTTWYPADSLVLIPLVNFVF